MSRPKRNVALVAVAVVVAFAVWVLLMLHWHEAVGPGGNTLRAVLAKMPDPDDRRVLTRDGEEYLALFGPIQVYARFPSGSPVYVFDRRGTLVDWTADEGDDEGFKRRWPALYDGRAVGQDEVAKWAGGQD
jgi:hypothetical protein